MSSDKSRLLACHVEEMRAKLTAAAQAMGRLNQHELSAVRRFLAGSPKAIETFVSEYEQRLARNIL